MISSKPRIGIVTPSYNQAEYLEAAIDSVLSAKSSVPLSYAIVDGGSTDGTLDIIRKYEKHLDYWVSEADRGQSHAINKGLRQIDFEVWAYLNSDDYYCEGSLQEVVDTFASTGADWVTGTGRYFRDGSSAVSDMIPIEGWSDADLISSLATAPLVIASQVSNFMSRKIIDRFGYFKEDLHYTMDVEYGLRPLLSGIRPIVLDRVLAMARLHESSKTVSKGAIAFPDEIEGILRRLDLSGRPDLEAVRREAVSALRKRNMLNAASLAPRATALSQLLQYLVANPKHLADREVLGAVRRRLLGTL